MTPLEGAARNADGSVRVVVGPGGALRELELREDALARGARHLAAVVLDVVRVATAEVGERARQLVRAELDGLPDDALAALGYEVAADVDLREQVESTTPDTWQVL